MSARGLQSADPSALPFHGEGRSDLCTVGSEGLRTEHAVAAKQPGAEGGAGDRAPIRVYVAGPMTGHSDFNYPAFNAVAADLRARGFEVENPAENPAPPCRSWLGYMRMSLRQISTVDAMVMLPGWIWSRGARIEWLIAKLLGLPVSLRKPMRSGRHLE